MIPPFEGGMGNIAFIGAEKSENENYIWVLSFMMGISATSLPHKEKMPSLTKGKMPSLTKGKMPSLTKGKMPSLTNEPKKAERQKLELRWNLSLSFWLTNPAQLNFSLLVRSLQ
jgi:hypothetical protein